MENWHLTSLAKTLSLDQVNPSSCFSKTAISVTKNIMLAIDQVDPIIFLTVSCSYLFSPEIHEIILFSRQSSSWNLLQSLTLRPKESRVPPSPVAWSPRHAAQPDSGRGDTRVQGGWCCARHCHQSSSIWAGAGHLHPPQVISGHMSRKVNAVRSPCVNLSGLRSREGYKIPFQGEKAS